MRLLIALLLVAVLTSCGPAQTPMPTALPTVAATAVPQQAAAPWWRTAVFYEIFVRSFYDTNGDGIGDFNGVTAKLDYLSSLGVNALWLMPINPSPSYHGYDVSNYYNVNPDYGTMDDFKRLLAEAHKRGMHVIIDLVLNHTSSQHPFFIDALKGPTAPYYNWYVWLNTNQGQFWHQVQGDPSRYYFGLFCDCMPDLNYRNPEVTTEMSQKVPAFWLHDVGVDGFRLDAVNRLIEEGTKTADTASTHRWLRGFYDSYKGKNPDAYAVGEVYGADASLVKTYEGDQVDQAFNFELAADLIGSANTGSNSAVYSGLTFASQALPDGNYATFLANHDQNRVMSTLSGDVNKAKLAAFLLFTSPGTPFIYYGEEVGIQGQKPDEDIRKPMQWDSSANGGFTPGTPWRAPNDFSSVNVAAASGDPNSLLSTYRKLLAVRNAHSALALGNVRLLNSGNGGVYAAVRSKSGETLLVLVNLQGKPVSDYSLSGTGTNLKAGTFTVTALFGSGQFAAIAIGSNGQVSKYQPLPSLPPYGMYILKIEVR